METREYRDFWKEAIHLYEIELNKEEAMSFVWYHYDNNGVFKSMDDKKLLLTYIGLVVYEKKYQIKLGSTTPASSRYYELLRRVDNGSLNKDSIYDVGVR